MIELLGAVPESLWSVALGSLITLFGILVSNAQSNSRLRAQLKHEKELREVDRKSEMRRDVYLSAAEELVRANQYLSSLPSVDLASTNVTENLTDFFASASKLNLVAEQETGRALGELLVAYTELIFKLIAAAGPISDEKRKIENLSIIYEETQVEIKRLLAEMRCQNESGQPDQAVFHALDNSFKQQQKLAQQYADARNRCWEKVNEHQLAFTVLIFEEMKLINELNVPVMVAIRQEMELETDIEAYRDLMRTNTQRIRDQADAFLRSVQAWA